MKRDTRAWCDRAPRSCISFLVRGKIKALPYKGHGYQARTWRSSVDPNLRVVRKSVLSKLHSLHDI